MINYGVQDPDFVEAGSEKRYIPMRGTQLVLLKHNSCSYLQSLCLKADVACGSTIDLRFHGAEEDGEVEQQPPEN